MVAYADKLIAGYAVFRLTENAVTAKRADVIWLLDAPIVRALVVELERIGREHGKQLLAVRAVDGSRLAWALHDMGFRRAYVSRKRWVQWERAIEAEVTA